MKRSADRNAGPAREIPGQIDALTSTRAIAAILVFIHHFGPQELFPPSWRIGNVAVGYFFVLSGFVLFLAYNGRQFGYANYLRRRIARILPVYLLALGLIIFPPQDGFRCILDQERSIREAILSAALLQAFVPTYPLTLNLPAWTISVEMFFYALFPPLLRLQQRSMGLFIALGAGLFVLSQAIHLSIYPVRQSVGDAVIDPVFFSPPIHLSQFLLGMIAAYVFARHPERLLRNRGLPLLIFALCIAALALRTRHPQYLSFQVGLIAPLFMLLILSIAVSNPPLLRLRPLVFLGEISYGIYILQWPAYLYLAAMNERHWHIGPEGFFFLSLLVLMLFAAIIYYTFEMPLKRLISRA